jgi:hypothetical protein
MFISAAGQFWLGPQVKIVPCVDIEPGLVDAIGSVCSHFPVVQMDAIILVEQTLQKTIKSYFYVVPPLAIPTSSTELSKEDYCPAHVCAQGNVQ